MKSIKHFHNWLDEITHEKEVLESLMSDFKSEADWDSFLNQINEDIMDTTEEMDKPDDELSRGEKIALSRNYKLLSKPQLAALFLRALGEHEGDSGKYLVMVPGLTNWGKQTTRNGFRLPILRLAEALGIESYHTAIRTINKFKNILKGLGSMEDEILYPKIIQAADEFKNQKPRDLAMIADEAVSTGSSTDTAAKLLAATVAFKERQKQIGQRVDMLVRDLAKHPMFSNPEKAEKAAISKIAVETGKDVEMVTRAYQEYKRPKR